MLFRSAGAIEVIKEIIDNPSLIAVELADIKNNLKKTAVSDRQKTSYWLSSIRNSVCYYDGKWHNITDYDDMINKVTAEEIVRIMDFCYLQSPYLKSFFLPKENK